MFRVVSAVLRVGDDPLRDLISTASTHTKCCRGEMFTLERLKLPPSPYKCLATANVIEHPQSDVARRRANVTRWRDREMVERWVASAWLLKEKNFRKSMAIEIRGRWPRSWVVNL